MGTQNPRRHPSSSINPNSSFLCEQSPSAILDILIFILLLFSFTFLLSSYISYIFQSLSKILPPPLFLYHFNSFLQSWSTFILGFFIILIFVLVSVIALTICFCSYKSRKCKKPGCKGLKNAMKFDIQLETEDCLNSPSNEIDNLPLGCGKEINSDIVELKSELKKMAPPNGRVVLIFRADCGCPISKLVVQGSKDSRRNKKALGKVKGGVR